MKAATYYKTRNDMETIIKFKTFVKTVIRSVNVQESNITQLINTSIRNGLDRPDMLNVSI